MTQLHDEKNPEIIKCRSTAGGAIESTVDCSQALLSFEGSPGGIAIGPDDTIWVSDSSSVTVWRVASDGTATPALAPANQHPVGPIASPLSPAGLAVAPDGSIYIADSSGHRICAVAPDGSVRVVAGGANGYRDGTGTEAMFSHPLDVAFAPDGTCYVADTGNDRIRRIDSDGVVTTVAGSNYDYGDGRGTQARFRRPGALTVDDNGTCWVADTGNNVIRRIDPDGVVTTLAGEPSGGDSDGTGPRIGLRWPTGIAVGADGAVWVADHGNGAVRRVAANGASHTLLRLTGLRWPLHLAFAGDGTLFLTATALNGSYRPEACLMTVGGAW